MTLTIPDVEKWDPGKLTTSATALGKLYNDLDNAVKTGTTKIENVEWTGTAAAAARTRMELEKTRVSAVSQALVGLETAFSKWAKPLNDAKSEVISARNTATRPTSANMPAFSVSPNGTVSAQPVIQWMQSHQLGPDGKTAIRPDEMGWITIREEIAAANQTKLVTGALANADSQATNACQAITTAKAQVDAAYNNLGDPNLGVGVPAPAAVANATAPAALTSNATTPHYETTSYSNNGTHHTGGTTSYSDASFNSSGGAPLAKPSGNVAQWIEQAREILIQEGVPPDQIDDNAIATIIQHESGGNPNAINNWDSNAAAGHPSKGLMQCIDGTFNQWAVPGHTDIWNPVDNIVACTRYSIHEYGSLDRVPGVVAVSDHRGYVGY